MRGGANSNKRTTKTMLKIVMNVACLDGKKMQSNRMNVIFQMEALKLFTKKNIFGCNPSVALDSLRICSLCGSVLQMTDLKNG